MARRTFLRYTRAERLEERQLHTYVRFFLPGDLHQHPENFPQLCSATLFGNTLPLELEIGCGSAEPLCQLAQSEPLHNFVGIDLSGPSLRKAAELATELQLQNILFLNADWHLLYPLLVPDSLHAVYLHFPDPHAKPGHQKKRIFSPKFLDALTTTLKSGGLLSVMTDHYELFMAMLELIEADERFEKVHPERFLVGFEGEVRSHFQRVWEEYGETTFRFVVRKIPSDAW